MMKVSNGTSEKSAGRACWGLIFEMRTGTVGIEPSQTRCGSSSARVNGVTSKRIFPFFEKISPAVLPTYNLCAAPLEQAKGLDLVGSELVCEKLINIAELFI